MRIAISSPAVVVTLAAIAFGSAGCYEDDSSTPDGGTALDISVDKEAPPADGASIVTITVSVSRDTASTVPINVSVSSGVVNVGAASAEAARALELKNDGTGHLTVPWRVGTQAGPAIIQVSAGGITRFKAVSLVASQPTVLNMSLDRSTLPADGAAHITATVVPLTGERGQLVSDGAAVHFGICCAGEAGDPVACTGEPPFAVIPEAVTAAGEQSVAVTVTVADTTAAPTAVIRAVLVADATGEPTCPPAASDVKTTAAIRIAPSMP